LCNVAKLFLRKTMIIKPSRIRLDASTVCQLKCPSCKTAKGITAKILGAQTLKFENFKNLVDNNVWIREIELSSQGEMFLNPDLLRIMEYAYKKNIFLSASTGVNLNTVCEEVLEGLVKYRFGLLTCAIDGASQETYKIYRRGGDFKKVLYYIKTINQIKKRYRSVLPKLRWQFILFGHTEHEILKARKMALQLGMEFYTKIASDDFSPIKNKNKVRRQLDEDVPLTTNEYRKRYKKVYLSKRVCAQLWLHPQINSDGRVLGCSINFHGDYGNAFKEDLLEILNGEKMNYARLMLLGKQKEQSDIPCVKCPLYQEMKATDCWFY